MSSSLSEDDDLSALLILLPRGIESSEEVDPSADLAFALLKRGFFLHWKTDRENLLDLPTGRCFLV